MVPLPEPPEAVDPEDLPVSDRTPEQRADAITNDAEGQAVIETFLQRRDDVAHDVLIQLALRPDGVGRRTLERLAVSDRDDVDGILTSVVDAAPPEAVMLGVLEALDRRRNDLSLRLSQRLAREHSAPKVRRAAQAVADSIFKVE